ncbi:MAG: hypothetical protein HKL96_05600 [Phycisphaerales bacterium]|nr:hypothetical protein [Phycisphaerales bacterium]
MRRFNAKIAGCIWLLLALLALGSPVTAGVGTAPATVRAAKTVTLTGVIHSPSAIGKIEAVNRVRADVQAVSRGKAGPWVFPGSWDSATARFTIPNVPVGHHYDLIVWNKQARWEGVNMEYYRPFTPYGHWTAADRDWLDTFIEKVRRFTNYKRPLWVAADHRHATAVIMQLRTTHFYSSKGGELIFRVAVWYFQRFYGGWQKIDNMGIVITRWRGPGDQIPNPWQYLPAIGGIKISRDGHFKKIDATLPSKASVHRGLDGAIPTGH